MHYKNKNLLNKNNKNILLFSKNEFSKAFLRIRIRIAAVILNKKNELLLVNHQKNGKSYWLFPGGGVEYGETFEKALKRELKEELSLKIKKIKNFVFINEIIYPDKKRHIVNLYFKVEINKNDKIKVNSDSILKNAQFFNIRKFKKILFYPDIKNVIIKMWKNGFKKSYGFIKTRWKG